MSTPLAPAVEVRGLVRRFGDVAAVDGLDLVVPAGSFFGFLGPNGAGKSTTIKCLTGLLRPTAGEIRILGLDLLREPVEVKRQVGVVPEDLALFDRLTGREMLRFVGAIHGLSDSTIESRSSELLSLLDLGGASDLLAGDFSHGMKKKLSLACALLAAPKLLFLDEPFEGVDAVSSRQVRSILASYVSRGGTVFLTSHILEIVERLCDRIAILAKGRIVVSGTLSELREHAGGRSLEELFLESVGATKAPDDALSWLA